MRRHLSLHLSGDVAERLDEWRRRWDPVMAAGTPPHVTLVYPEETTDEAVLLDRIAQLGPLTAPLTLRLATVVADGDGHGGVFVAVEDPDGRLEAVRDRLLVPPLRWSGWPFHTTIAHPRTSHDPAGCWRTLRGTRLDVEVTVTEVLHTETDRTGRRVLATYPLTGFDPYAGPVRMAGAVLLEGGRVLLGRRSVARSSHPGLWDIPGGHVEPGESPRRALRRELGEELGIDPDLGQPWRRLVDDDLGIDLTVWIVEQWIGQLANVAPDEHDELRWVGCDELDSLPMVDARITDLVREALIRG